MKVNNKVRTLQDFEDVPKGTEGTIVRIPHGLRVPWPYYVRFDGHYGDLKEKEPNEYPFAANEIELVTQGG